MSRIALVTGGAVRVGRAITLGLAEAGFDLVVNYRSSESEAEDVAAVLRDMGRRCILAPGDVSKGPDVARVADAVRNGPGRLDLLVNNASIFRSRPFLDVDEEEWDLVMGVNLKGPFLLVRELAPLLTDAVGSVVNIVDLSAFQPWTLYPHHAVSKAGLLHLTRVMARALAPAVRVNAVAPGNVLPPEDMDEEWLRRDLTRTPLRRRGAPEDVVRTVLFLADSPFVTGEVVVVDGGRRLLGEL